MMEPSQTGHSLMSWSQEKVIGVAKENLDTQVPELTRHHCLYRRLCAHRHENRRLDNAVRRVQPPTSRPRLRIFGQNLEFHVKRNTRSTRSTKFLCLLCFLCCSL